MWRGWGTGDFGGRGGTRWSEADTGDRQVVIPDVPS